jgi:hypothetical protein
MGISYDNPHRDAITVAGDLTQPNPPAILRESPVGELPEKTRSAAEDSAP